MERTFDLAFKPLYESANLSSHQDVSAHFSMAYMTALLRQMAEFSEYAEAREGWMRATASPAASVPTGGV